MNIRIGDPIDLTLLEQELPETELWVKASHASHAPFQVFILQETHQQIWRQVKALPNIECGGVLVGHPFKTPDQSVTFVVIVGHIPQVASHSSIVHFTVGPQETAAAREQLEEQYPGFMIVGWYHSHPGHGIFLSGQDMTIVRSIYNSEWHLALVVDPQRKQEGFFVGGQGKKLSENCWIELKELPESLKTFAGYPQSREAPSTDRVVVLPDLDPDKQSRLYRNGMQYAQLKDWRNTSRYLRQFMNGDAKTRAVFQMLERAQKELADEQERESQRLFSQRTQRVSRFLRMYLMAYVTLLVGILSSALLDQNYYFSRLANLFWAAVVCLVASFAVIYLNVTQQPITLSRWETLLLWLLLILLAGLALATWAYLLWLIW